MLVLYAVAFKLFFACYVLAQDTCRILEFTEPEAGSYLEHHVIQKTLVDNNGQCEVNCYVEKLCLSYNLGMLGSGDKFICELSDSDHYQHPKHLVSKKGFSYHPTAKLCGGLSCPPAASCLPNQQGNFRCVCPAHWPKITNCEREIFDTCYNNAVGVTNSSIIPDDHMTASSYFGNYYYKPAFGRLNYNRGGGWCANESSSSNDWLQVDLGKTIQVCAVATQGDRGKYFWVTHFNLSYSSDGSNWTPYKDENGADVELLREGGGHAIDKHTFPVLLSARYIRFHPTKQQRWNCLRVEVYGTERLFFHWALDGHDPFVSLYNGASYNTTEGRTVLYLDGKPRSYAETPAVPIQKISFSLMCWVKVLSQQDVLNIYSDWSAPHQFRLGIMKGDRLCVDLPRSRPDNGRIVNFCGGDITIGEWMHVAFTWSRENKVGKLYINRTETGQQTAPDPQRSIDLNPSGHTVFDIGFKRDSWKRNTLHGYLRDLMVIDRAIADEELKSIFDWSKK